MLGHGESIRECRGVMGALGAGRECRYSGASRGISWLQGVLGTPRECRGHWGLSGEIGAARGALGPGRECRNSGASRGIGGIRGIGDS